MHRMFLYPSVKAGHWETEKAGYKNADFYLYGASHKTCFDTIHKRLFIFTFIVVSVFVRTYSMIRLIFVQTNCDTSQKNSAVVIFLKNYRSFFIVAVKQMG